nr:MAG TPA: hypothetical protein [Caudoviricetes sp.]
MFPNLRICENFTSGSFLSCIKFYTTLNLTLFIFI